MEVMVGIDPKDPLTEYSKGKAEVDYQQFLVKNGLENARIGVLGELTGEMDSEISGLFEKAILDLGRLGAEVIDPIVIPNFAELRQNQWCATFEEDLEAFLSEYVKNDSIQTLEDIIRIGSNSQFAMDRLKMMAGNSGRWGMEEEDCGNAYEDPRRIAFREAIEAVMDSLQLDAIVYPSWNYPAARIERFQEEYRGDNSQIISPIPVSQHLLFPWALPKMIFPRGFSFWVECTPNPH